MRVGKGRFWLSIRSTRRAAITWGCAALLAALGFAQAAPQTQAPSQPVAHSYTIQGSLRLTSNSPAPELIKVELKKFSGEVVAATYTHENGEFRFAGLSGGIYLVVIEEEGFEPIHERIELRTDTERRLHFYLREPPKPSDGSSKAAAVSARELALSHKPGEALRKGREALFVKKDPGESLEHFNKLVREAPAFYEAHFYRGLALSEMGLLDQAEASLRKAIEQSGQTHIQSFLTLASLLSNHKRYAEAEPLARKGTELDAASGLGHFELARALHGVHRFDEALKAAETAKGLRPDFPKLYLLLINIHIRRGDARQVLAAMDEYLRLLPQGAMSDNVRAERKKLLENMARARQSKRPVADPPPQSR